MRKLLKLWRVIEECLKKMSIRTYSELMTLPTFKERFEYLRLRGNVGEETFGFDRYLNQKFYRSDEWLDVRDRIIIRDLGRDLGVKDRKIPEGTLIIVHHMNPVLSDDIVNRSKYLLNEEFLITTTLRTHNAIHYGNDPTIFDDTVIERRLNDTCPWK